MNVLARAGYVSTLVAVTSTETCSRALFRFGSPAEFDEAMSRGSDLRKYVAGCE